jgi:hypothetical protein
MNKFSILVLAINLFASSASKLKAQDIIKLQGLVVDTSSNASPIRYVSIGIIGKDVGTISNDSGHFDLNIPCQHFTDSLIFSRVGYHSRLLNIKDLINQKNIRIILIPKNTELDEVQVIAKGTKAKTRGNITRARGIILSISSGSLGSEVGTVIHLPNEPVYIKNFNIHITSNQPDSAKFRLNFYSFNNEIGDIILNENIYFTVSNKYVGDFKVDLSKYHLSLDGEICISVEPVVIYSKGPAQNSNSDKTNDRIDISGTLTGSKSFYRKVSLGKWQKIKYSFSPGFWITYLN